MSLIIHIVNGFVFLFTRLFKNKSADSSVIILSFKFIGDTVFTIPAIQTIMDANQSCRIIICCYALNREIYRLYFNKVSYCVFESDDLQLSNRKINRQFLQAVYNLRAKHPGTTIDLTSCLKSAIMSAIIGSPKKIGFGNHLLTKMYDFFVPAKEQSQIEMFLEPVELYYGIKNTFRLNKQEINIAKISICIIPFAGWNAKEWGVKKFTELADRLSKHYNIKILYEPGKMDNEVEDFLLKENIEIIRSYTMDDLIRVISENSLIISNDTGPLYIGYLMGKYSFGIFGPTNPHFHLIDLKRQRYIQKKLICSPKTEQKLCFTFGGRKGCPSYECMNYLSVKEVFDSINEFISLIKQENNLI